MHGWPKSGAGGGCNQHGAGQRYRYGHHARRVHVDEKLLWKDQFPVVSVISAEQRAAVEARWSQLFRAEGRPPVVEAPVVEAPAPVAR